MSLAFDLGDPVENNKKSEYTIYFMEILLHFNLFQSTREKYISFVYKLIEQCRLLKLYDSDCFTCVMIRENGDVVLDEIRH